MTFSNSSSVLASAIALHVACPSVAAPKDQQPNSNKAPKQTEPSPTCRRALTQVSGGLVLAPNQPKGIESRLMALAQPFGLPTVPSAPSQFVQAALMMFSLRDSPPPDLCSKPPAPLFGPSSFDIGPIFFQALNQACINVTSQPGARSSLGTFNCQGLQVGSATWNVTGAIEIGQDSGYSVTLRPNLKIETTDLLTFRELGGGWANNGVAGDTSMQQLSLGVTDSSQVGANMGGDGKLWVTRTLFQRLVPLPPKCTWAAGTSIDRSTTVSGRQVFETKVTPKGSGATINECRWQYSWR